MLRAIRYIRWSTLEQGNSDRSSEERQLVVTTEAVQRHGWEIAGEPLIDKGRSAFTGENLSKGELGALTKRLHSGALDPRKTVLVVEELDRLSRQPPSVMQAWMMPLLALGLTIHIARTGQTITQHMIDHDIGGFMTLMVSAFSAYEFSRKQRDRGNAAWEKRRAAISAGEITSKHRARKWLRWDDTTKCYVLIADRAKLIRLIASMLLRGIGKGAIAKHFNERMATDKAFETWPVGKKKPPLWTATYIKRIVHDPAITGFVQYHRAPRGADKKVPLGKPMKVYPAVIDQETFDRINDSRAMNQAKHQGKGRNISNLFGPRARCAACGGLMQPLGSARFRINKDGSKSQHYFLYCVTAKMTKGKGCSNQAGWPYRGIEQPLLDVLLDRALDNQHFAATDDEAILIEGQVFGLRRRVDDQTKRAQALIRLIEPDEDGEVDPIALSRYGEARDELKSSKKALAEAQEALAAARGKVSPQEHILRVSEVRSRMESDDVEERYQARSTVKDALQSLITSMVFDEAKGRVVVDVLDGLAILFILRTGQTSFFDLHKPGRDYSHRSQSDQELIQDWERRKKALS